MCVYELYGQETAFDEMFYKIVNKFVGNLFENFGYSGEKIKNESIVYSISEIMKSLIKNDVKLLI